MDLYGLHIFSRGCIVRAQAPSERSDWMAEFRHCCEVCSHLVHICIEVGNHCLLDHSILMDIIHQSLSLVPVPCLAPAFSVLRFIWSSVEQAQASKQQLQVLAQTITQLLSTVNREYSAGRLMRGNNSTSLADLGRFTMVIVSRNLAFSHHPS
jgi:hypothetical protein